MAGTATAAARPDPVYRVLLAVARAFAVVGGIILVAVGTVTVVSVIGRYFFFAPIRGDFELVEMGCAYAVFLFLPYCQLIKGNVAVDFFTAGAPAPVRHGLDAAGSLLYVLIAALLAWRIWVGAGNLRAVGETSIILGFPLGWVVLPGAICFAFVVIVAAYTVWRDAAIALGRRAPADATQ